MSTEQGTVSSVNVSELTSTLVNFTRTPVIEQPSSTLQLALYISLSVLAFLLNLIVLSYIMIKRAWRHFVSNHFIAHLTFTNLLALLVIMPIFITNATQANNFWRSENATEGSSPFMCRIQMFGTVTVWAVINYMLTCVAGVHLQTFARIHYDQLFGLRPAIICLISWVIGTMLGLPSITNSDVVRYDLNYHYCVWQGSVSGFKAIVYVMLLGIVLPTLLTWYAYFRVLGILFHSPIVFEALGLYKSRWLVYWFVISPLVQVPFFAMWVARSIMYESVPEDWQTDWLQTTFFMANAHVLFAPVFYGLSIFVMKEEDMNIQARNMHKGAAYHPPAIVPQQL